MAQSAYEKEQTIQMVQRAIAHGTAGTTDTSPDIFRLPVQSYSPNSWQEEMDAIFRRLPLMLALSCELRQPGDYKAMKVLNVPVLTARGLHRAALSGGTNHLPEHLDFGQQARRPGVAVVPNLRRPLHHGAKPCLHPGPGPDERRRTRGDPQTH